MISPSSSLSFWAAFSMSLSFSSYLVMAQLKAFDTAQFIETAEKVRSEDGRVLLMFDVDGTLKSFSDKKKKDVNPWVDKLLVALCKKEGYDVYLNTGKSRESLTDNYGTINNLGWYGEHGALFKAPGWQSDQVGYPNFNKNWLPGTMSKIQDIRIEMGISQGWPGEGNRDNRKDATITFTAKKKDDEFKEFYGKMAEKLSESAKVTFHHESGTLIEVTPLGVDKGTAVGHLKDQGKRYGLALAVGDDERDSDMFQAIKESGITPNAFAVMITEQAQTGTQADYSLKHYYELLMMLQKLVPDFTEPFPV